MSRVDERGKTAADEKGDQEEDLHVDCLWCVLVVAWLEEEVEGMMFWSLIFHLFILASQVQFCPLLINYRHSL